MNDYNNNDLCGFVNISAKVFSEACNIDIPKTKLLKKKDSSNVKQYACKSKVNTKLVVKPRYEQESKIDHKKLYELTVGKPCQEELTEEQQRELDEALSIIGRSKLAPIFYQKLKGIESRSVPEHLIKDCIRIARNNVRFLSTHGERGELLVFPEFKKGVSRYYVKQQNKIMDILQFFINRKYETCALTITYEWRKLGSNREKAWKHYIKHIHSALEHLRKNWGARYCWVIESTLKGFPHAHIVIAFPKGTVSGYEQMQNRTKITYGKLYEEIKKRVLSPVFHLEAIKGKNTNWYLSKYITKFSLSGIDKSIPINKKLSKSEKKLYLAFIYSVMTGVRLIGHSVLSKGERDELEQEIEKKRAKAETKKIGIADNEEKSFYESYVNVGDYRSIDQIGLRTILDSSDSDGLLKLFNKLRLIQTNENNCENSNDFTKKDEEIEGFLQDSLRKRRTERELKEIAPEWARYLIRLCNNSLFICSKEIRAVKRACAPPVFRHFGSDFDQEDEKLKLEVWNYSHRITCKGCIYSELYRFIKTGESEYINIKVFHLGETIELKPLFEKNEQRECWEWLKKVLWVMNYYQIMAREYGFTMNQSRIFFETFDNVCDDYWLATTFQEKGYKGLFELLQSL